MRIGCTFTRVLTAALVGGSVLLGSAHAQTWTNLNPGGSAIGDYLSKAVYDPATNSMLLFGGEPTYNAQTNEVTALNLTGAPHWTTVAAIGARPAPRNLPVVTYDESNSRLILFSGALGSSAPCASDVWVLANANGVAGTPTWTQLSTAGPTPPERWGSAGVYDPGSNRLIVYGGNSCFSPFYADTWVLEHANGLGGTPTWTQLSPSGPAPPPSGYHSAVYDAASNRMILFGVLDAPNAQLTNTVWILEHANGLGGAPQWHVLAAGGSAPPPIINTGLAYDSDSNMLMVALGQTSSSFPTESWILSHANGLGGSSTWTQLSIGGNVPPPRQSFATAYVPGAKKLIVHGGADPSGVILTDTWVLSVDNSPTVVRDLLVSSLHSGIRRYDGTTGALKGDFVAPGSGGLNGPTAFAFGPDGNLYVSSIYTGSIKRYDGVTGAYIDDFVPAGSGGGIEPYEIAFGPDGNLYVANGGDFNDAGVKRFSGTNGAFIDEFIPDLTYTTGVAFGPDGHLYVIDFGAVSRYNGTTGEFIDTIAPLDPVGTPIFSTFGPDGHLYVNYFYGHRIQRFDVATAMDLGTFVPAGSGGLFWVSSLGFGPDGNLYTTERYSNAVYRFDGSTGDPLGTFVSGVPDEAMYLNWFPGPPANNPPTAVAGPNQSARPGITVILDGSGSFDDNTPTGSLQYAWSFSSKPVGSTTTLAGAATSHPAFVPDVAGTYVVALVVTDHGSLSSPPSSITIADNPPPTADAGLDQLVMISDVVSLTGSGSDPNIETLTYQWQLISTPAGNTAQISNGTSANATLVPNVPGTYLARLVVSDPLGPGAPDDVLIEVVTTGTFIEIKIQEASSVVANLPASALTSPGNQNALINKLSNAVKAAGKGNYARALNLLESAIRRTDGCSVHGAPDTQGGNDRDWITTCDAQADVYPLLVEAHLEVVSAAAVIESTLLQAVDIVARLPLSAVTSQGNKSTLVNKLSNAANAAGNGHFATALNQVEAVLGRVDGCALNGSPDTQSGNDRDWITTCAAQAQVYPLLVQAQAALTP